MMYAKNLACCIKVNGRVLREQNDVVRLPFGCEYSILLKNLNNVRVQFKLQIDGTDATSDTWIVIPANQSVEMERFIKNGNWDTGNKFKFIERSPEVEAHRGVGAEDGLVRIEFKREYVAPYVPPPFVPPVFPYDRRRDDPWDNPWRRNRDRRLHREWQLGHVGTRSLRSQASGSSVSSTLKSTADFSTNYMNSAVEDTCFVAGGAAAAGIPEAHVTETGITVEGSRSDQHFTTASWFATEPQSHVMVLHLKGEVAGQPVTKPVTVERRLECSSCGKIHRGDAKFCVKCGTSLISYA